MWIKATCGLFVTFLCIQEAISALCGGTLAGPGGIIDGTELPAATAADFTCNWDITVGHGYIVEITIHMFNFIETTCTDPNCGTTTCKDRLRFYEALTVRSTIFCQAKTPSTIFYSRDRTASLEFNRDLASTSTFLVSWRAIPAITQCCKSLIVDSTSTVAKITTIPNLKSWLGSYTCESPMNSANSSLPVYTKEDNRNRTLAHMDSFYYRSWVMSTVDFITGDSRGVMFFKLGDTCPSAPHVTVTKYDYYDSITSRFAMDTIDIAAFPGTQVTFTCTTACKGRPATPSTNSATTLSSTALLATYKCVSSDFKLYSICQPNGLWSSISGTCPTPPLIQQELLPNLPAKVLTASANTVVIRSPGWPKVPYKSGILTWKFRAAIGCRTFSVSFDNQFDVRGNPDLLCVDGDKVSIFKGSSEDMSACGTYFPDDFNIFNQLLEYRVQLTANNVDFGIGFKATITANC